MRTWIGRVIIGIVWGIALTFFLEKSLDINYFFSGTDIRVSGLIFVSFLLGASTSLFWNKIADKQKSKIKTGLVLIFILSLLLALVWQGAGIMALISMAVGVLVAAGCLFAESHLFQKHIYGATLMTVLAAICIIFGRSLILGPVQMPNGSNQYGLTGNFVDDQEKLRIAATLMGSNIIESYRIKPSKFVEPSEATPLGKIDNHLILKKGFDLSNAQNKKLVRKNLVRITY